jgi:hypothetical protein
VRRVELDDPAILDDHGDRAVPHPIEEAAKLGDQRVQVIWSGRVETGQRTPRGRPHCRIPDEADWLSRQ